MNDPIVDEVRRIRDAHAARFNYDLEAIFRDIKEREKKWGHEFVGGIARLSMTNEVLQATGAALLVSQDSRSLDPVPPAAH